MRYIRSDTLMHVGRSKKDGAPVGSGRYPLGSGKAGRLLEQNIKGGKDKPNKSAAEVFTGEASRSIREAGNLTRTVHEARRSGRKKDYSHLSDDELRRRINRMNLERQYAEIDRDAVDRGFDHAERVLAIAGGIATIGASAATIAATVYKVKKGN